MKLILHIGTGKTGSTTIQEFLEVNKAKLLQQDIYYPETHGVKNHSRLHAAVKSDTKNLRFMRARGFTTPELQKRAKAKWEDTFISEIKAYDDIGNFIVSSEHFCSLDDKDIRHLKAVLQPLFSEIEVLLYIRDPIQYAVSMYDTALKTGGLGNSPQSPRLKTPTDYQHLIKTWVKHFGQDAIRVRIFDRKTLVGNDIVTDFADATGIDIKDFEMPSVANPSMNLLGQKILLKVNKKLPLFLPNGKFNIRRANIHQIFERHFNKPPKYSPPKDLVDEYQRVFAKSNEWVRETYFPDRKTLFEPREYPDVPDLGLSEEQTEEIANTIVEIWTKPNVKKW